MGFSGHKFKIFLLIIVILVGAGIYSAIETSFSSPTKIPYSPVLPTLMVMVGSTTIPVEVARTTAQLTEGLSDRTFLPADRGMFFIFPYAYRVGIWMKDMHFPIDIAWLDEEMRIIETKEHVSPDTYPAVFKSEKNSRFVLELNDGFMKSHQISVGAMLRIVTP